MATYGQTISRLRPVIKPIFEALDTGLRAAAEDHGRRKLDRPDDPWFYAYSARRIVCDELKRQGLQAVNEMSGRPTNPMSGLLVTYDVIALKILRPTINRRGQVILPVPGRSLKRRQFWRQEPAFEGMQTDNIILLWHDKDGVLVEPLTLFRPLGGSVRRDSLQLAWVGSLDRTMATMRAGDLKVLPPAVEFPDLGDSELG
jgi:hypothetical protein